jgi:hypothetical protein
LLWAGVPFRLNISSFLGLKGIKGLTANSMQKGEATSLATIIPDAAFKLCFVSMTLNIIVATSKRKV